MSKPRVLIITGLGLNCEAETEAAFTMAGASADRVHLLELLDGGARKLADHPILAFVGGFAFGAHGFVRTRGTPLPSTTYRSSAARRSASARE